MEFSLTAPQRRYKQHKDIARWQRLIATMAANPVLALYATAGGYVLSVHRDGSAEYTVDGRSVRAARRSLKWHKSGGYQLRKLP